MREKNEWGRKWGGMRREERRGEERGAKGKNSVEKEEERAGRIRTEI